ncbi:MAG TPA: hypothetical protein VM576_07935 [Xanthomonadaceae bacterium]|nr:hypothetical protein [Xanthomonadaceae bacterium]
MSNRNGFLLAMLMLVATGAIVGYTAHRLRAPDVPRPPRAAAAPAAAPVAAPANAATTAASDDSAPPPWAGTEASPPAPDSATVAGAQARREQHMQELQRTMQALMADVSSRSQATNAHLRQALDTLEQMDDPQVNARVNLPAVRHNLDVAIRMQQTAAELQRLMLEPDSPARRQRLDARMAEFRQLRAQLRDDVQLTPPPAPASSTAKDEGTQP